MELEIKFSDKICALHHRNCIASRYTSMSVIYQLVLDFVLSIEQLPGSAV